MAGLKTATADEGCRHPKPERKHLDSRKENARGLLMDYIEALKQAISTSCPLIYIT